MMPLVAIIAVGLPTLAGTFAVDTLSRARRPLAWRLGMGFLTGQFAVVALLYVSLRCLGGGNAGWIAAILGVACAAGYDLRRRRKTPAMDAAAPTTALTGSQRWLLYVITAGLVVKLAMMLASVSVVTIRGDDAISIWLYKAKVIASLDALPLDPDDPYYLGGSFANYPLMNSLAAAWPTMLSGAWDERLAVASWPAFYLAAVLVVAGGLRADCGPLVAWAAAYVVASVPLAIVHVLRPGYADLPLAAFAVATMASAMAWRRNGHPGDLALALIMATAMACWKREGIAVALIIVLVMLPTRRRLAERTGSLPWGRLALLAAGLVTWTLAVVDFSDQAATLRDLGWQPGVIAALERHAFRWSSFGLLFWLIAAGLAVLPMANAARDRAVCAIVVAGMLAFVAGVFLLTPQSRFALNDQTPSRLLLQIAPAMIVALTATLFDRRDDPRRRPSPDAGSP
jgi:hypothetical protein